MNVLSVMASAVTLVETVMDPMLVPALMAINLVWMDEVVLMLMNVPTIMLGAVIDVKTTKEPTNAFVLVAGQCKMTERHAWT